MQRLIDANELEYTCNSDECGMLTGCNHCQYHIITEDEIDKASTVLTIPENPTNGDMIKALYPNALFVEVEHASIIRMRVGDFYVDFNKEWWNAPYKESEG